MVQRSPPRRPQGQVVARQSPPCRRRGCGRRAGSPRPCRSRPSRSIPGAPDGIGDRHGDRVALDRIDRDADAERLQQQRRIAAERQHIGVRLSAPGIGLHAGDPAAVADDAAGSSTPKRNVTPSASASFASCLRELEAVAGLVARQAQPAGELLAHHRQRRFDRDAAVAVQHLERHAGPLQDRDVVADAVQLLLRAEKLQRALGALVVADAGLGAQRRAACRGCIPRARTIRALLISYRAVGAVASASTSPRPTCAGSSCGQITSGRCCMNSHLIALNGNAWRRPRATNSRAKPRPRWRSWFPAPHPAAGRPPSPRGRPWPDNQADVTPITPLPRTRTFTRISP